MVNSNLLRRISEAQPFIVTPCTQHTRKNHGVYYVAKLK